MAPAPVKRASVKHGILPPWVKKPADHPKYSDMIAAAIKSLNEKTGSSRQAIAKYIKANYKVGDNADVHVKQALKRGVASGALSQPKGTGASGSFKVVKKESPTEKKPAAKKSATKKPAAAAKKPAAKKSATITNTSIKKPAKKPAAATKKTAKISKKPAAAAKKPADKKAKKPAAKKSKK